jgi:hypothetical protein
MFLTETPAWHRSKANLRSLTLHEANKHCKTIAASGAGVELLGCSGIVTAADEISRTDKLEFRPGLVASRESYVQSLADQFVKSIGPPSSLGARACFVKR